MWQTENDLRTYIRELDRGGDAHCARLMETMSERDGSSAPEASLAERLLDRIKRVISGTSGRSRPVASTSASVHPAK